MVGIEHPVLLVDGVVEFPLGPGVRRDAQLAEALLQDDLRLDLELGRVLDELTVEREIDRQLPLLREPVSGAAP